MSEDDPHELRRFLPAQDGIYGTALTELRSGRKRSHWMWFVFPRSRGWGPARPRGGTRSGASPRPTPASGTRSSARASSNAEGALFTLAGPSAHEIFGAPGDVKLKSSATLFATVSRAGSVFERLLDRYFAGERDDATLRLLGKSTGRR